MTIFDPISGRQITIDLSGKPSRSTVQQEYFIGGEQQARADQAVRAGKGSKSAKTRRVRRCD